MESGEGGRTCVHCGSRIRGVLLGRAARCHGRWGTRWWLRWAAWARWRRRSRPRRRRSTPSTRRTGRISVSAMVLGLIELVVVLAVLGLFVSVGWALWGALQRGGPRAPPPPAAAPP